MANRFNRAGKRSSYLCMSESPCKVGKSCPTVVDGAYKSKAFGCVTLLHLMEFGAGCVGLSLEILAYARKSTAVSVKVENLHESMARSRSELEQIPVKRIVICADGTWNFRDQLDKATGKRHPSNVTKVARAILPRAKGIDQALYYHDGVREQRKSWISGMDKSLPQCT